MFKFLANVANAQEDALNIGAEVMEDVAEDSGGFFGPIVAIFRVFTDEVAPAFKSLWYSLFKLWGMIEDFLSRWIGEPLLRYTNQDVINSANDATSDFIQGGSDSFWNFFIN